MGVLKTFAALAALAVGVNAARKTAGFTKNIEDQPAAQRSIKSVGAVAVRCKSIRKIRSI